MRSGRQGAAQQPGNDRDLGADPAGRAIGQQEARRYAHEGLQHVVDAVDIGDLVGKEIEREQEGCHRHHPRRGQHLQIMRQAHHAQTLGGAQDQDGGVCIEAARPAGAQRHGNRGKRLGAHRSDLKGRAGP